MNTKSKRIKKEFENILEFSDERDRAEHRSKMIMFNILDIVEREMEFRKMNKKDLAEELQTSASYVTQLFTGAKTINLLTIAKLEAIFNIRFRITKEKVKLEKGISGIRKSKIDKEVITA